MTQTTKDPDLPQHLTPREQAVLELLARGFSNRDIADRLFITEPTVRQYVSHVLRKYRARNRTELTALYLTENPYWAQHNRAA